MRAKLNSTRPVRQAIRNESQDLPSVSCHSFGSPENINNVCTNVENASSAIEPISRELKVITSS